MGGGCHTNDQGGPETCVTRLGRTTNQWRGQESRPLPPRPGRSGQKRNLSLRRPVCPSPPHGDMRTVPQRGLPASPVSTALGRYRRKIRSESRIEVTCLLYMTIIKQHSLKIWLYNLTFHFILKSQKT